MGRPVAWVMTLAATTFLMWSLLLVLGGAPALAVGPQLYASPSDPRQGDVVTLVGDGFGAGPLCELRWDDLPATEPACAIESKELNATLRVPADAALGRHVIAACAPACPDNQDGVVVTVRAALTTVPDLIGQTFDEARASLSAQGLDLDPLVARPTETRAVVDSQDPEAGNEATRGSTVSATFAVPPDEPTGVEVPDLAGMRLRAARRVVSAVGLDLAVDPDGDGRGRVDAQVPAAGTVVEPGSAVTVTLQAQGTTQVEVPDVVGLELDDAQRLIEQAGLIMRVSSDDEGRVATQNPVAGATVPIGSVVGVAVETSTGAPDWLPIAVVAAVAALLGALVTQLGSRSRRHDRRWVEEHVTVVPVERIPSYDVASAGPSHSARLVPHDGEPVTDLQEVPR